MVRSCCCTDGVACNGLQKHLTALEQHHMWDADCRAPAIRILFSSSWCKIFTIKWRVGLTCIPKKFTSSSSPHSVDYNVYRSSIIHHLRLQGLKDNSGAYVAYSHWHPAVLELHRENRLKVAKMMFPRTLSLALGKEIGLTEHDKIQGDSCVVQMKQEVSER